MAKLTEEGNAIIICRECRQEFDKGCPPQPGQDDSSFKCESCQQKTNAEHLQKIAPTMKLDGDDEGISNTTNLEKAE